MRKLTFCGLAFLSLFFCSFSGCEGGDDCSSGFCPSVKVMAQLSEANDTLYVGDSLIVEMRIPDNVFSLEDGDTIWEHVNNFEHLWGGYAFHLIDTSEEYKLGNPEIVPIVLVGGDEDSFYKFSTTFPYENKVLFVLKKPGVYFLASQGDAACRINGSRRSLIIDFDVSEKHIEWLEPYIVPNGGSIGELIQFDEADIQNFYAFRVLKK